MNTPVSWWHFPMLISRWLNYACPARRFRFLVIISNWWNTFTRAARTFHLPPDLVEIGDNWQERLWCSDGKDLFFSEFGLPESFAGDAILLVFPDDGHRIRAVYGHGSRLMVGKTNKVHFVIGTDRSDFEIQTLSDKHGCYSHHSMKSAEGFLFWYGGDNFYRSDGANVESISTIKIRRLLDRIPDSRKEFVVSGISPRRGLYLSAVTLDSGTKNTHVLAYNYRTEAWTVLK